MLNRHLRSLLPARTLTSTFSSTAAVPQRTMVTTPPTRPPNWKELAPPPPPGTTTFSGQKSLEKLPVLELNSTLRKLKRSLRALAWTEEEYRTSEAKIDEFAAPGGMGPELQRRLEARHAELGRDHWLEEWWDESAYLAYRDPVMINVSFYYGFNTHPKQYPQTPAHRASALTRAGLLFRRQLRRGLLQADATKEGPLCMDTYRWMFDGCRVPAPQSDWSVTYSRKGDTGNSGHVVVFRKGRPWKVDVAPHGQLLSTADLQKQFEYIYNHSDGEYPGVGALTSSDRDTWAKNYALLSEDPHNASILGDIHSAAFVVSLDNEHPANAADLSRALWHAGASGDMLGNRWFDKAANFVVFDNVQAGVVGEHSVIDGTPLARACDEMIENLHSESFDHGSPSSSTFPPPQALDWKITPTLSQGIIDAINAGKALINAHTLNHCLTKYGKAAIKRYGFSPDSWTHMIIQLAYYRLVGPRKPGGTYESATTRRFLRGRTEVIRVLTVESEAWVRAMHDPAVDDKTRRRLFTEAAKVHIRDAREAGKAQGIDRHLLGLKKLVKDGETMPPLFSDPLYLRSSRWTLSTSSIWSKHFTGYGWGEVVPDGFGIPYMTGHDDHLLLTVTSRKEMPNAKFVEEIAKAANDLQKLFESDSVRAKL